MTAVSAIAEGIALRSNISNLSYVRWDVFKRALWLSTASDDNDPEFKSIPEGYGLFNARKYIEEVMKMTAGKKDEDYKDQTALVQELKKNEEEFSEEPQDGFEEITHTLAKKFENPLCIDDLILEYDGRKVVNEGGIVKRALSFDITLDGEFYEEKLNMSEEVKLDNNTNGLVFNVEKLYGKCFNDISINFKYHVTKEASSYGKVNMKLSYKEGKRSRFRMIIRQRKR